MTAFDHPDPDWTPRLAWGDPIPLHWVRVSAGLWFVWPPRQFESIDADGPIVWRADYFGYRPDRPCRPITQDAETSNCGTSKPPVIAWGNPLPAHWQNYGDGRAIVFRGDFEVSLPPSRVVFRFERSFGQFQLDYYHPHFIWSPPISPPSAWASCRCGPTAPPDISERPWFFPTHDGRRWVTNAWIEPNGVTMKPLPKLLPLDLPSDADVAAEKQELRKRFRLEDHEPLHVRPRTLMLRDLATSATLMERVGEDAFATDFQMFVRQSDFMHRSTGNLVGFNSEDDGAWMLSVLRRYGEIWQDCELYRMDFCPENRAELERLFLEIGYVVVNPPMDPLSFE